MGLVYRRQLFSTVLIAATVLVFSCHSFPIALRESSCDILRQDGCNCMNAGDNERSCCCTGRIVDDIPRNLWPNVTKLIMKRVGITQIRHDDFRFYTSLNQIEIIQAPNLINLDAAAFAILSRLKKLSITDCPKLDHVDGYLKINNNELLSLEIKRTGMTRIPRMKMIITSLSAPNIDFSENEIQVIEEGDAVDIVVASLRLSHNRITRIADFAFKQSKIFVLRLDNNPITEISALAFSGISELKKLDLSYTELQSLPERGLRDVEELNVEHTPTLKQLPPLLVFKNLKEAKLTYAYHCCLFKAYATLSRDFTSYSYAKQYEGNLQELREKYCFTTTPAPETTSTKPLSISRTPKTSKSPTAPTTKRPRNENKMKYKKVNFPDPLSDIDESLEVKRTRSPFLDKAQLKTTTRSIKLKNADDLFENEFDFQDRKAFGNCTDEWRCNGSQSFLDSIGDWGSGDHLRKSNPNRKVRNRRQVQKSEVMSGQFGIFYDDEDYEDDEAVSAKNEEEEPLLDEGTFGHVQLNGKASKVQSQGGWGSLIEDQKPKVQGVDNFKWGAWHDHRSSKEAEEPMTRSREPFGSMLTPRFDPNDHGTWDTAPVFVPKVVVPCVDGDRAVHEYYANVKCTPQPDALNPCEDVMIGWTLRILIFFVWIAAVVGNVLVIAVLLITTAPRQRVNNFLMMNLAFADLCTGVYLAMLAIEDVTTRGEYYNYAVAWQTGWGCKIAGTLTIFASELSIATMVMISFEVWYNTKYAIYQKRLSLSVVFPIMVGGWIVACTMALLPLVGVSDYSVTSTCLPLRLTYAKDRAYIIGCLFLNVLGFAYIVFNYVSVYCTVAGSNAPTAHAQDVALAKLMFCLIFTDFLCWAPTVLFGFTAAVKVPLISISVAKVFLVLFYPLNAFANPWLYVFLTKRFRKNASNYIRKHVWLREFLTNTLRHHSHNNGESNNYFYQDQPHNPTQTTNLTSQRSSPSTCSSALVTPRGSKASLPRSASTPADSTPRSGSSGSCNEILIVNETSAASTPLNPPCANGNCASNGVASNGVVTRRKSTTQKFRPHMSDIIENSNSNSTEDDPLQIKHLQSVSKLNLQKQKSPQAETNGNLFYDYLPSTLSTLIGRRRGSRRSDEGAAKSNEIELQVRDIDSSKSKLLSKPLAVVNPTRKRLSSQTDRFPQLQFSTKALRQRTDSESALSTESGYGTATPLLLTPDTSNPTSDFVGDDRRNRSICRDNRRPARRSVS